MSEREIVRKDGPPLAFKGPTKSFIRCGVKCNPQQYSPSFRHKGLRCKRPHHKCRDD